MEPLYWRPAPVLLCLRRVMEVRGFCFKDALQVGGSADDGRLVQARVSLGGVGCRRRALVLDQWTLGCGPCRRTIGDAFISSVRVSVYCDFQSPVAIGLLLIRGRRRDGDELLRWLPAAAVGFVVWRIAEGPRVFFVFLLFVRGLSANHLWSVSFSNVPVFIWVCIRFP